MPITVLTISPNSYRFRTNTRVSKWKHNVQCSKQFQCNTSIYYQFILFCLVSPVPQLLYFLFRPNRSKPTQPSEWKGDWSKPWRSGTTTPHRKVFQTELQQQTTILHYNTTYGNFTVDILNIRGLYYIIHYSSKFEVIVFNKEIIIFCQQGCIKLIKNDSEDIYHITKYVSNKCFFFYQKILKINCIHFIIDTF